MSHPLTIWTNAELSGEALRELREGTESHRLVIVERPTSNLVPGTPDDSLQTADVAFGQPDPAQVIELPALRWVHITSAGYTRYDTPEFEQAIRQRGASFTNSSSVYDEPCAQHLLAMMLASARGLPQAWDAQGRSDWGYSAIRPITRVLEDETVLIVGFGAIARRLVELLAPYRLRIVGLRRKPTGQEEVPVFPISELDRLLPEADHIVNILPASRSTEKLFDAGRFALAKPGARFYNVGRGTTVDQEALRKSLTDGRIATAYLDVTDPEPLPADDPLWKAPNCHITPHVAGGRQDEAQHLVRHFLANLRRYEAGEPLRDRVF